MKTSCAHGERPAQRLRSAITAKEKPPFRAVRREVSGLPMRGVEGAGAYRTGHPLVFINAVPHRGFQKNFGKPRQTAAVRADLFGTHAAARLANGLRF